MKAKNCFYLIALFALTALCTLNSQLSTCLAQGTAFTYQGRLNAGGVPANGVYDLTFTLVDGAEGENQVGGALTNAATAVSNGLFTVTLDFGNQFPGVDRWLEIGVRTNGGGAFATLTPRQQITSMPYAIQAGSAASVSGSVSAAQLTGTVPLAQLPASLITNGASGVNFSGTFNGDGGGLIGLNPTSLSAGTAGINISGNAASATSATTATTATTANNFSGSLAGDVTGTQGATMISSNFPRLGGTNVFTSTNQFASLVVATNVNNQIAGAFTGNGGGLTNLSGGQITGTIPLAQLPTSLLTNGASGVSITGSFTGNGGGLTNVAGTWPRQIAAGTTLTAQPNTVYDITNNSQVTVTLPSSATVGDLIQVDGTGAGGWVVSGTNIVGTYPGWISRASPASWSAVASSSDGTKLVAVINGGGIWTSMDSGVNWSQKLGNSNWTSVASSADGTKLVAVQNRGALYTSTDSGVNWTSQSGAGTSDWTSVASSADGLRLVVGNRIGAALWGSTDGGVFWRFLLSDADWRSIASSADGLKLVAASSDGVWLSKNGGVNWVPGLGAANWTSVASSADGLKLIAAVGGGIVAVSMNGGTNWSQSLGAANWTSVASSADGTRLVAVQNGGAIYTSTDSGVSWAVSSAPSPQNWSGVASSADGYKLVAVNSGGFIYTYTPSFGAQGTSQQFQYRGGGLWQALTPVNAGDGSALTNLYAGSIAFGTIADARLSANVALLNGTNVFTGTNGFAGVMVAINVNNQIAGTFTGNGSGLTNLNAANVTSGTLADARHSANVPLLNSTNVFTGTNRFAGVLLGTNVNNQFNGSFTGNGGGLTNLNAANVTGVLGTAQIPNLDASQITTGTFPDSRLATISTAGKVSDSALSANVALLNRSVQAFTGGTNSFSGNVGIGTTAPAVKLQVVGENNVLLTGGSGMFLIGQENAANIVMDSNEIQARNNGAASTLYLNSKGAGTTCLNQAGGKVGIGTDMPTKGTLEIAPGSGSYTFGSSGVHGTFLSSGVTGNIANNTSGTDTAMSLYCSGDAAGFAWYAFSDQRIKRIKGRSDAAQDLDTLLGIEVTDYTYIDTVKKGAGQQKKLIAQQVEKVFPQAVSQSTDEVPDIYEIASIQDGWVKLATNLKKGERVKLIADKARGVYEVLEVAEGKFRIDFRPEGDKVFVYGREVKDFRTVDYEAISMLNVSATQELARKVKAQEEELSDLRAEVSKLRSERASLTQSISDLKAGFTRLEKAMSKRAGITEAKLPLRSWTTPPGNPMQP